MGAWSVIFGGSIIFWPCTCWILKKKPSQILVSHTWGDQSSFDHAYVESKKNLGGSLVCHMGGSIIFWPWTCWIIKKNSRWKPGLSWGVNHLFGHAHVESLKTKPKSDPGLSYLEGQSSFDHGHVESLKKILGESLVKRISPRIFLKIQHVHGQRWLTPSPISLARILPRIFFKDSTCACSKDDWPPSMAGQDLT